MSNPICGSCGKSKNKHHKERGDCDRYHWYCYEAETGSEDEFRSEPSDSQIVAYFREEEPAMLEMAIKNWKRSRGHEV